MIASIIIPEILLQYGAKPLSLFVLLNAAPEHLFSSRRVLRQAGINLMEE